MEKRELEKEGGREGLIERESIEKRRERGGGGGARCRTRPREASLKKKTNQGRANERLHLPDMKY